MRPPLFCFAIIYEGEDRVRTRNGKLLDFCGADKFSLMKVLTTATQTDPPHRMKVFDRPFYKKVAGAWGRAPNYAVFWFFFAAAPSKKNGESLLNVRRPDLFPAFFFDTAGAKKKAWQRRNAEKVSRLRARSRATRPWMGGRFFQKATQKL